LKKTLAVEKPRGEWVGKRKVLRQGDRLENIEFCKGKKCAEQGWVNWGEKGIGKYEGKVKLIYPGPEKAYRWRAN